MASSGALPIADVPGAELVTSPEPDMSNFGGNLAPKTAFWDLAPSGAYYQFDDRLITPWERVSLAGFDLPGRCVVASPGRVRKVKTYSGPGDEGEEIIDLGATAADVQIVVQIWTKPQLAKWEQFVEMYQDLIAKARSAKVLNEAEAPAMDVAHPGLALAGVTSVFVYQISILTPSSVRGMMESTILASEYRSLKKAKKTKQTVTPVSSSLDGLDGIKIDPAIQPKTPSATETNP